MRIQHVNVDINTQCGGLLCPGNPLESSKPIQPLGWGENHEIGRNLQRTRLRIYRARSNDVASKLFPLHTSWRWTVAQGLTQHPTVDSPNNWFAYFYLQRAIKNQAAPSGRHPMWRGNLFKQSERLSFYMQLIYTHKSWSFYTKIYLLERIFSDAIKSHRRWDAVRSLLGFSNYTRLEARNMEGNDFMYVAASVINNTDYRDYFSTWGIAVSQMAWDQVGANGISEPVPLGLYYVHQMLPAAMPGEELLLPLDGVREWDDPRGNPLGR